MSLHLPLQQPHWLGPRPAGAAAAAAAARARSSSSSRRSSASASSSSASTATLQTQQPRSQRARSLLSALLTAHLADAEQQQQPARCARLSPVLDELYDGLDEMLFFSKGGFVIPPAERREIDATGGSASYGELQDQGVDVLLWALVMDSSSVFVDLGCGRGRAVLQVAAHARVAKALGLELSDSRLEQADAALAALQQAGVQLQAPVEFRRADLSSCSLEEGTHFYLCSTAFGAAICRSIAERLAASPNFQALVTSRQLPSQPHLYKLAELPCAFSYNADGRAYLYIKSPTRAPARLVARQWCRDGVCWLPGLALRQLSITADQPLLLPEAARRCVPLALGVDNNGDGGDASRN